MLWVVQAPTRISNRDGGLAVVLSAYYVVAH
jgi:hypothetical protein